MVSLHLLTAIDLGGQSRTSHIADDNGFAEFSTAIITETNGLIGACGKTGLIKTNPGAIDRRPGAEGVGHGHFSQ